MQNKTKIVIVGATSGIAERCARIWVMEKNIELILIGRNLQKLQNIAEDLRIRGPEASIQVIEANFTDPKAIALLVNSIAQQGKIDRVLIAQGMLPKQEDCQQDLVTCYDTLMINAVSPALFAEAFIGHLQKNNHGTLAIIGSVAGDRGRKFIYTYGAAKALIAHYAQGLQHRLARSNVKVVLVKPGPTATTMTAHLNTKGLKLADPNIVATDIVRAMARGTPVIYTPRRWGFIMTVIRTIPAFIFNRLEI